MREMEKRESVCEKVRVREYSRRPEKQRNVEMFAWC